MIKYLYSLLFIFSASQLYLFAGANLGIGLDVLGGATILANIAFMFAFGRHLKTILASSLVKALIFGIVLWPLASTLWAFYFDARLIGLQVLYATTVISCIGFVREYGTRFFAKICAVIIAVSIVGIALSFFVPGMFAAAADASASRGDFGGRAFGFFMQPNTAAYHVTLLFMVAVLLVGKKQTILLMFVFFLWAIIILITGSKGGAIVAVGLMGLILYGRSVTGVGFLVKDSKATFAIRSGVIALFMVPLFVVSTQVVTQVLVVTGGAGDNREVLLKRLESITLDSTSQTATEQIRGSADDRLLIQAYYIDQIRKRPIFGHGLGSRNWHVAHGNLLMSSHNVFLETAQSYGIPYALGLIVVLLYFLLSRKRVFIESNVGYNFILQFCVFSILASTLVNSLLDWRAFHYILGLVLYQWIYLPSIIAAKVSLRSRSGPVAVDRRNWQPTPHRETVSSGGGNCF